MVGVVGGGVGGGGGGLGDGDNDGAKDPPRRTTVLTHLGRLPDGTAPSNGVALRLINMTMQRAARVGRMHHAQAVLVATIKADGQEGPALTWLHRVLGADGFTPSEQHFLNRLEGRLYP